MPMLVLLAVLAALNAIQIVASGPGPGPGATGDAAPASYFYGMLVIDTAWSHTGVGIFDVLVIAAMVEHARRRATRVVAASQPTLHRGAAIFAATRRRPRARCSARAYGSRPRQPPARDQPRVRTANRPRLLADRAKVPSVVLRLAQSTALALPATQRHSAELNQGSTSRTARN